MPNDFVHVAEESGLIIPIGKWVLRNASANENVTRPDRAKPRVAVNLSARQFEDKGLIPYIADVLAETGLDASCLNWKSPKAC